MLLDSPIEADEQVTLSLPKVRPTKPKRDPAYYREWRAKDKARKEIAQTEVKAAQSEPAPVQPATEPATRDLSRPPRRLQTRTKERWQTLSTELKEDIWAREENFDKAFKRYDGLGKYAIEAEKNGRTLADDVGNWLTVVNDFVALQEAMRADPIGTTLAVWERLGIPNLMAQAYQEGRAAGKIEEEIAAFRISPDHGYFDILNEDGTLKAIATGNPQLNLQQVYDAACASKGLTMAKTTTKHPHLIPNSYQNPAIRRAMSAAKHVGGSPSTSTPAKPKEPESAGTAYDDVAAAIAKQMRGS
jgi:hypothetical protein